MPNMIMRVLAVTEGKLRPDRSANGVGAMLDAVESWISPYFDRFRIQRVQLNEDDKWFDLRAAIASRAYDQIWFFGSGSPTYPDPLAPQRPLDADELDALRTYMDDGGGVFATGDHADVGASLCASIPRVRHMRSWGAHGVSPPKEKQGRAETTFMSSLTGKADGEQDAIGKPVWVKGKNNLECHDLLRGRDDKSAIRWLPDHMHEGECLLLPDPFDAEVAKDFARGAQAEIVAWSMRRGFVDANGTVEGKPAVHNVVGCYDGSRHGVGRVVVDSTFHHWVQENNVAILSSAIGPDLECYPRNIAQWLSKAMNAPQPRRNALRILGREERIQALRAAPMTTAFHRELGRAAEELWVGNGLRASLLREILVEQAGGEPRGAPSSGHEGAADIWNTTGRLLDRFLEGAGLD